MALAAAHAGEAELSHRYAAGGDTGADRPEDRLLFAQICSCAASRGRAQHLERVATARRAIPGHDYECGGSRPPLGLARRAPDAESAR